MHTYSIITSSHSMEWETVSGQFGHKRPDPGNRQCWVTATFGGTLVVGKMRECVQYVPGRGPIPYRKSPLRNGAYMRCTHLEYSP